MSEPRLPENVDQWPNDPFALLGVTQSSNRRDVKRAYAKLIRVYKPEHFPEQFRRIRDAYELLDQRLAWVEAASAAEPEIAALADDAPADDGPDDSSQDTGSGEAESGDEPPGEAALEPFQFPSGEDDEFWQKARQGDLAEAYAHFSKLAGEGRGDDRLFARLFWMLRLTPDLDPGRDAREWLVAGLKQCGLRGRLPELYRAELTEDPQEALHGRCAAAIHCSGHSGLLAQLVIARWEAAVKLGNWELIGQDLASLRSRLQDELPVWGQLLLTAIDYLAWIRQEGAQDALAAYREEMEQVAEHFPAIAGDLNQRDVLLELVRACDQLKFMTNLPLEWRKSLRDLLAASWSQPFENLRRPLLEILAQLVQNPVVGLEWLDRLAARCSPAMHRLGALIVTLAAEGGVGQNAPPADVLGQRLIEFLYTLSKGRQSKRWMNWMQSAHQRDRSGRLELLMFCLQESVTVRQLVDLLASVTRQDLAQLLAPAGNAPLHLICLAYLAFWA